MGEDAISIFGIELDYELEIMQSDQTLNQIAGKVFERLSGIIDNVLPDYVIVQGDTTTAASSALCAFNKRIPVAHVEAGLRSFDIDAPYPEECNRRIISCFATYNFCPTAAARDNLLREAVPENRIHVTGNTIVDALRRTMERNSFDAPSSVHPSIGDRFVLVTAHRREHFGVGFENICSAIKECALTFPDVQFVYPVHLNPNVQKPVNDILKGIPNVILLPPVSYLQLLALEKHCLFILTDSGGIQEEAPTFRKYCIVLRDRTERTESVTMGLAELVGVDKQRIVSAVTRMIHQPKITFPDRSPYGDGMASKRILDVLSQ